MRKLIFLFVFILSLTGLSKLHAQWQVVTSIDTSSYLVGDPIKIEFSIPDKRNEIIKVESDSASISLPENMSLLSKPKWKKVTQTGSTSWNGSCIVAVYDSGRFEISSMPIQVESMTNKKTVYSSKVPVYVKTIYVNDSTSLAPIKDIITTPRNWKDQLPWIIAVVAFILILILAIYFIKKKAKKLPPPIVTLTPLAAYDKAKSKLLRLKELELWKKDKVVQYQTELTEIIRQYITDRYGIEAMKMSTEEILAQVASKLKDKKSIVNLGNLLEVADYVKFAKAVPPDQIHEHVMELAEKFLEKTRS